MLSIKDEEEPFQLPANISFEIFEDIFIFEAFLCLSLVTFDELSEFKIFDLIISLGINILNFSFFAGGVTTSTF